MLSMKKTRRMTLYAGAMAVAAGALFAGMPGAAVAEETIDMIAIDGYPERAMWVREFSGFFIPRVDEELAKTGNYKINWQESYGGAIVNSRRPSTR